MCLSGGASFGYCASFVSLTRSDADIFGRSLWSRSSDAGRGSATPSHYWYQRRSHQYVHGFPSSCDELTLEITVAAFTCTRTDDELKEMLVPALADNISACEESIATWMKRAYRTGARFDTVEWARKASFFTMGSMTFKEAFERTGKILNVSVIPYDTHSSVLVPCTMRMLIHCARQSDKAAVRLVAPARSSRR